MTETVKHGKGLKRTGMSLLIPGFLLAMNVYGSMWESIRVGEIKVLLVKSFLAIIMLSGGAFLYWRGRQYAAKATAEGIIGDSKPDVLYLRAFQTDTSTRGYVFSSILMPFTGTEEDHLSEVLQPFGDLVAIGEPSETLPTPGAARLYASDAEWKKVVTDQMQTARLVVIRAGSGQGLLWELKQAVQVLNPKQLLILVLNMKKKDYEAFTKQADQVFEGTFPKADENRRFARAVVPGFVRFSANWKPTFLPLRAPFFRRGGNKPYLARFKFTLRPVFEEYGLEWQSPPVRISTVWAIVLFSLLFVGLITEGKLLIACAMLVVVGAMFLAGYSYKDPSQRRLFIPAVSRNILVAIIALFVWLTETYMFFQLGQPDTLKNAFWMVFFPAVFVAFVWATWPLFPAISGAWRSVLRFLASTVIFCLWFFASLIAVMRFGLAIVGSIE